MLKKNLLAVTTLSSLLFTAFAWAAESSPLTTVEVQTSGQSAGRVGLDAVVEAVRQTTLSAQVPGAITSLGVKAGDVVKAGQELLWIDARSASQNAVASDAQVDAAQSAMNVAAKDYERQKQLFQKQYISQSALDRAQAQWQAAQAQVKAQRAQAVVARTQSGFFIVNAPYAGVISDVPVALGDMAMPGRALITMHDPSALRITAAVPQSVAATMGDASLIQFELPGLASLPGLLRPTQVQVLPVVDAATHTVQVRLGLPAGLKGVTPGLFARIWLPTGPGSGAIAQGEHFYVPASAVVRRSEMTGLYVVNPEGLAVLRQVRLGSTKGDLVEILSGVSKGDKVAVDPQAATRVR